jgi:signal recognition particle GTPase
MGIRVKITIEIADSLLSAAKKRAVRERTTVRALVESGLRQVLAQKASRKSSLRLRDATFNGTGLARGVNNGSWERIREIAYEGHGG